MTSCRLVSARRRICSAALTIATSSGTAITARPRSIRLLKDLGRSIVIACGQLLSGTAPVRDPNRMRAGHRAPEVGATLPRIAQQSLLPGERGADDRVEIVEPRLPAERRADPLGASDEQGRIAFAARLLPDREPSAADALDTRKHFTDAVAVAVAAVEHGRLAATAQVVQSVEVRAGQVLDMDVVAHTGPVGRRIIRPEDAHVRPLADGGFAGDFDEERCLGRRLSDAAGGVRPGHVK